MKKKALALAIASALTVPMAAHAVKVKVSGQVNKALLYGDDGVFSQTQIVDNDNSSTRFRFTGSEDLGNGITAGIHFEVQEQSNPSNDVTMKQTGDIGDNGDGTVPFFERVAAVYFKGSFGTVYLGQAWSASDGTTEKDLSGTSLADYGSRQAVGGDFGYRTAAGAAPVGDIEANYNNFDGLSRADAIRYDSPKLGPGIVLKTSAGTGFWDVAATIGTSFGGGKFAAGLHYAELDRNAAGAGAGLDQWGGSASFLFSQGTSVTFHYAEQDLPGAGVTDPDTYGIKLGHKFGNNAVSVSYSESSDVAVAGRDAEVISLAWVHKLKKPKVELYALYRNWELNGVGTAGLDEIDIVMVGSRIKF